MSKSPGVSEDVRCLPMPLDDVTPHGTGRTNAAHTLRTASQHGAAGRDSSGRQRLHLQTTPVPKTESTRNTLYNVALAADLHRSLNLVQVDGDRWRSMQPASACGQAEGAGARPCGPWAACIGDGRLLRASTHSASLALPGRARKVRRTCTYGTHNCKRPCITWYVLHAHYVCTRGARGVVGV